MNRPRRSFVVVAIGLCAAPVGVSAQQPAPAPCATPEHRQFDFWVGDWEVVDTAGTVLGRNRITRMLNDCVLHEKWTGARGTSGESFNIYQHATGTWHQSWVDTGGNLLLLDGALESGTMVLRGESAARGGGTQLNRISYIPDRDGTMRQLWEVSTDRGTTWTVSFDGRYRRVMNGG